MREISFVKKIKFNFSGSVTKRALVIGDADNDKQNELVCANLQGDLGIFKGMKSDSFAYASNLGMVTACTIGDVLNSGKNFVTTINMEGWLFVFDVTHPGSCDTDKCDNTTVTSDSLPTSPIPKQAGGSSDQHNLKHDHTDARELEPIYEQRMPANCKEFLLADLDGDGHSEIIIGLTDRVLRTYKWVKIGPERGKFVGLYKWEFADQIGSVSLNPSRHANCQDIIVAQPGGTYARLECFDKKPATNSSSSTSESLLDTGRTLLDEPSYLSRSQQQYSLNSPPTQDEDNVKTEYINKLTPEYHQLALSQMRNHHVSTEVLGCIKDGKESNSYSLIVIATLDGTLMLVNKDEILWSLQVDHQLFALAVLNSYRENDTHEKISQTNSSSTVIPHPADCGKTTTNTQDSRSQYFVACAWNGKTYIIDEERNYLRFKFGEAVSAFTAGSYYFEGEHHASLVYATFNNQIILYYDVLLDNIRPMYLLKEIVTNPEYQDILAELNRLADKLELSSICDQTKASTVLPISEQEPGIRNLKTYEILNNLLYSMNDPEAILINRKSL